MQYFVMLISVFCGVMPCELVAGYVSEEPTAPPSR
jgi:hypothetical protein